MKKLNCSLIVTVSSMSAYSAIAATNSTDKVSKMMDTNGDGMVSKEEYMAYHEQAYSNMKKSNGGVSDNDIESGAKNGF
jgi:hypothetical protein